MRWSKRSDCDWKGNDSKQSDWKGIVRGGGESKRSSSRTKLNPRPASRSPKLKAPLPVSGIERLRNQYRAEMFQYLDLMQSKFELELRKKAVRNNPLTVLALNEKLDTLKEKMHAASKRINALARGELRRDKWLKEKLRAALYERFVMRLVHAVHATKKIHSEQKKQDLTFRINAIIQVMHSDLMKPAFEVAAADAPALYETVYHKIHPSRNAQTGRYISHTPVIETKFVRKEKT